jgi:hypothetical protein
LTFLVRFALRSYKNEPKRHVLLNRQNICYAAATQFKFHSIVSICHHGRPSNQERYSFCGLQLSGQSITVDTSLRTAVEFGVQLRFKHSGNLKSFHWIRACSYLVLDLILMLKLHIVVVLKLE